MGWLVSIASIATTFLLLICSDLMTHTLTGLHWCFRYVCLCFIPICGINSLWFVSQCKCIFYSFFKKRVTFFTSTFNLAKILSKLKNKLFCTLALSALFVLFSHSMWVNGHFNQTISRPAFLKHLGCIMRAYEQFLSLSLSKSSQYLKGSHVLFDLVLP